jgi:twitching motility protein PilT
MSEISLNDLSFQDLYIRWDNDADEDTDSRYHFKPKLGEPRKPGNFKVPEEFKSRIDVLRSQIRESKKKNFALDFDGIRMRVVKYDTVKNQSWSSLRRIGDKPPELSKLNFENGIIETIREWGLTEGLIIVGGSTGSGKTTTVIGMLNEFLNLYGGTLYTIEDPVEYILQGEMGNNGFVIQREVEHDSEWAEYIKDSLRSAPKYIFVGEIRDAASARQLLRAATSGHLAICTIHGSSVEESLSAMVQNAKEELGDMTFNLIAEGLTAVLWQEIIKGKPHVKILDATDTTTGIRSLIRSDKFNQLGNEILRQETIRKKKYGGIISNEQREGQNGERPRQPPQNPTRVNSQNPTRPVGPNQGGSNPNTARPQQSQKPMVKKSEDGDGDGKKGGMFGSLFGK